MIIFKIQIILSVIDKSSAVTVFIDDTSDNKDTIRLHQLNMAYWTVILMEKIVYHTHYSLS